MTDTVARIAFTAREVAEMLGVSFDTVRRATAQGLLPCRRLGRSVRYTHADIQVYLDAHRDGGYV